MKPRTSAILGILLILAASALSLYISTAGAQTLTAPTRSTPYTWQCQDASGARVSDHEEFVAALFECWNNRAGDHIVGGVYQLPARTFPNRPPTISGTPPAAIEAGQAYAFTPTAADEDNDTLGFTITNRPAWATFDPATGALTGAPTATHVGVHSSIVITVSDGKASASTSAFSITVTAPPPPPVTSIPAPGGISAVVTVNTVNADRYDVALSWLRATGATAYEVERCTGATCTANFIPLGTTTNTVYRNVNIPGGFTYRYRIRGTNGTVLGAWSALRTVTTPTPTTPPPPPAGAALLEWTAPTQNTNGTALTNLIGYRVLYGTSPTALTRTVTLANAALSTYTVTDLTAGTWHFALRAIAGDPRCLPADAGCLVQESANSNTVSKTVQ